MGDMVPQMYYKISHIIDVQGNKYYTEKNSIYMTNWKTF